MTASVHKFVTTGDTNLRLVNALADSPPKFKGIIAVNTAAYAIFVKLYWFKPTASAPAPTVGTTVPQLTILLPALATSGGGVQFQDSDGSVGGDGQLWVAVTKLAADSDTTAVVAGDGIISLLIDP